MPEEQSGPADRLTMRARVIGRSVARVYRDWTEPSLLMAWWPVHAEINPRVGGSYHFSWPTRGWHLRGKFLEVLPEERLRFTWTWDHEPGVTKEVEVRFAGEGSGVRVDVVHGPYDQSSSDVELRNSHRDGWMYFLGRLETIGRA